MPHTWASRLIVAAHVFVFVELVGWHHTSTYTPLDWGLVLLLDVIFSMVVFDLIMRWHAIPFQYTVLLGGGVFGMLHGSLITLGVQSNLPLSLTLFGTGMPTLMFVVGFYSFIFLWTSKIPLNWIFAPAVVLGLLSGLWLRSLASIREAVSTPIIGDFLPYLAIALTLLIAPLYMLSLTDNIQEDDWQLTPIPKTLLLMMIGVVAFFRMDSGLIAIFDGSIILIVLFILLALLWFNHSVSAGQQRFQIVIESEPNRVMRWMMAVMVFIFTIWLAYEVLGTVDHGIQADLLLGMVIMFGVLWPPALSFLISMQAFIDFGRQEY